MDRAIPLPRPMISTVLSFSAGIFPPLERLLKRPEPLSGHRAGLSGVSPSYLSETAIANQYSRFTVVTAAVKLIEIEAASPIPWNYGFTAVASNGQERA